MALSSKSINSGEIFDTNTGLLVLEINYTGKVIKGAKLFGLNDNDLIFYNYRDKKFYTIISGMGYDTAYVVGEIDSGTGSKYIYFKNTKRSYDLYTCGFDNYVDKAQTEFKWYFSMCSNYTEVFLERQQIARTVSTEVKEGTGEDMSLEKILLALGLGAFGIFMVVVGIYMFPTLLGFMKGFKNLDIAVIMVVAFSFSALFVYSAESFSDFFDGVLVAYFITVIGEYIFAAIKYDYGFWFNLIAVPICVFGASVVPWIIGVVIGLFLSVIKKLKKG